jgi:hypothetical protein
MHIRTDVRFLFMFLAVVLLAAACISTADTTTTTAQSTTTTASETTTTTAATTTTVAQPTTAVAVRHVEPFSTFEENPLIVDTPQYGGPATPTTLDGVLWMDEIDGWTTDRYPGLYDVLTANGFAILDGGTTQFHEAYGAVDAYRRQPLFVTTDAAYHYWHLTFAKALKDTEAEVLLPILEEFAVGYTAAAEQQVVDLVGAPVAENATKAAGLGEVLGALVGTSPGPYSDDVEQELALVRDHLSFGLSPVTGAMVDYTLLTPRGHYTETKDLTRYFLSMGYLGTSAFQVAGDDQLLTAVLVSRIIVSDPVLADGWRDLYEPTAFLVGLADDYTPFEVADAVLAAGVDWDDATQLDSAAIGQVRAELLDMRDVAIDPGSASVRVMGARFVLDSFILDQLVYPNVPSRMMGSPLDVAAAFGSDWAYQQMDATGATADPDYVSQMAEMRGFVESREPDDWAGTVYDAWLYAIQPTWAQRGDAYPDFMRSEAWSAKAHQSGFGSYTELKHDTVLYAKQGFAEGEGPPPPPAEPRHWVEPDPVVYARLAAVASVMQDGLLSRGLLADDVADLLSMLIPIYERFERLALDELGGLPISHEDNLWLESIGAQFELLWLLANQDDTSNAGEGGFSEAPYDMAGVVVDIMSNPDEALEIGTGLIDRIYVLVPNDSGQFQLARGGVYSYYEFTVPRSERMTDEEWRKLFVGEYGGTPPGGASPPDRPTWTQPIVVEFVE